MNDPDTNEILRHGGDGRCSYDDSGDLTFTYLNGVELRMVNDDGIKFLIEENSAKIKVLTTQNKRLREELFRRADGKEEKTKDN